MSTGRLYFRLLTVCLAYGGLIYGLWHNNNYYMLVGLWLFLEVRFDILEDRLNK